MSWQLDLIDRLRSAGADVKPGLRQDELDAIALEHQFVFPSELAAFLTAGYPTSHSFPLWRTLLIPNWDRNFLMDPVSAVLVDVRERRYWLSQWGERPAEEELAVQAASDR